MNPFFSISQRLSDKKRLFDTCRTFLKVRFPPTQTQIGYTKTADVGEREKGEKKSGSEACCRSGGYVWRSIAMTVERRVYTDGKDVQ